MNFLAVIVWIEMAHPSNHHLYSTVGFVTKGMTSCCFEMNCFPIVAETQNQSQMKIGKTEQLALLSFYMEKLHKNLFRL